MTQIFITMRASMQTNLKTNRYGKTSSKIIISNKGWSKFIKRYAYWSDRLGSDEIAELQFVIEHLDQAVFDLETSDDYKIYYQDLKS